MSWATAGGFRRNNFDVLRIAFAVLVIYSHCYPLTGGKMTPDPIAAATRNQLDGGFLAVNGFFIISGYLIAHSWVSSRSARSYAYKRAKRILPGFMVAMAITALVIAPVASEPWRAALTRHQLLSTAKSAVLLRGYPTPAATFPHNPSPANANGSMWTIKFEAMGYVGIAVAGSVGLLGRRRWTALLMLALMTANTLADKHVLVASALAGHPGHRLFLRAFGGTLFWPRMATYFWAGTTFYTFRASLPQRLWAAMLSVVAIVVGVLLNWNVVVFPLAGTYLLFWFAYHPLIHLQNFAKHGDYSYGTYLYAFPIQQLIVRYMPTVSPLLLFAMAAPASVLAGAVSWYAVERRFLWTAPTRGDAVPAVATSTDAVGTTPQPV